MQVNIRQELRNRIDNPEKTIRFFISFYIIGAIGFLFPFSFPFFLKLIPFVLLFNFIALMLFHPVQKRVNTIIIFSAIFLTGFFIEVTGVNNKIIFGEYGYGESLGPKLFFTPLIIGMNWLFLVYTTSSAFENLKVNSIVKIVLSSSAMVVYDLVLEQVAPKMDMWYWKDGHVPFRNFLAWFIIALFFNSLIKLFHVETKNKLAITVLICQFLFFLILSVFIR